MREQSQRFFGAETAPFAKPPRAPFLDDGRTAALEQLRRLVARRGFGVLSAPPGCGKTSLLHYLADELVENRHQLVYLPFSFLEQGRMLHALAAQAGLEPKRGAAAVLRQIRRHFAEIQPINPVVVLDEAERLETETLRMLRQILNDRADTAHHCTLILAGTDSFVRRTLRLRVHEPLRQRITLYARVDPLAPNAVGDYLGHCLKQAGLAPDLFEPAAVRLLTELADGVPRLLNNLADAAMDLAADEQSRIVQLDHVRRAAAWTLPPQSDPLEDFGRQAEEPR